MKRVVMGDQFDVAELIKKEFILAIVSVDAKLPATGDVVFTLPHLFPNPMGLKLLRAGEIEEFEKVYFKQLDDMEAEATIAALLFGIIEHRKRIAFIRYNNEIMKLNIETNEEEFIKYNFLESLKHYLRDKYDIDMLSTSDFLRRYGNDIEEFGMGRMVREKFENWKALKNKYKELLVADAPTKEELDEHDERNEHVREVKDVVKADKVKVNNIAVGNGEELDIPPHKMPVSMIRFMADDTLLEYVSRHNLDTAIKAKFRVGSVLDVDRVRLAEYIKYGV